MEVEARLRLNGLGAHAAIGEIGKTRAGSELVPEPLGLGRARREQLFDLDGLFAPATAQLFDPGRPLGGGSADHAAVVNGRAGGVETPERGDPRSDPAVGSACVSGGGLSPAGAGEDGPGSRTPLGLSPR